MPRNCILTRLSKTACAVLLPLSLGLCACSDQAPEPKPSAQAESPANATAPAQPMANASLADATVANATVANATVPLADVLAGNASLLAPELTAEAANATLAACALPVPPGKGVPPAATNKAAAGKEKISSAKDKAAPRPAKVTASAAPAKPKAAAGPLTPERARLEFVDFARQWVARLSRNMLGNAARMAVTQEGSGYVARFAEVEQDSMEFEVKATDSPSCPFVGILKYFECSYESRGESPEAARAGSFSQVRKVRVTELFRHSGAKWE